MSEQRPQEPVQPAPQPQDQSLLPPPEYTGATPPPAYPGMTPPTWAPPGPPAPPSNSVWNRIAAFMVLIAVVAAAAGAGIGWSLARAVNGSPVAQSSAQPEAPIQPVAPNQNPSGGSSSTAAIAAKVSPAIVDINTTVGGNKAAGTGMIVSSTGEILTNNHVVSQSSSITVTVQGRSQTYTAHVVGVDLSKDIAVIQIDGSVSGLPTVSFASSSTVKVGDAVVAIGNALGQGGAPANAGSVTNLNQTITASEGGGQSETLNGMIESDALIYEGDSGGALVNSSGHVIGMITAGQAQGFRSSSTSVGYAVASDTFLPILNRIRAHEQASDLTYGQWGYLGVQVQSLDANTAAQLGLNITSGALVVGVVQGSPAAAAGLAKTSVITNFGGTAIGSADALGPAIKSHQSGDRVSMTWVDGSGSHTAMVTLSGVNP
jgi:S1-C subfamily serine protease